MILRDKRDVDDSKDLDSCSMGYSLQGKQWCFCRDLLPFLFAKYLSMNFVLFLSLENILDQDITKIIKLSAKLLYVVLFNILLFCIFCKFLQIFVITNSTET